MSLICGKAKFHSPGDPDVEILRQKFNRLAHWLWRKGFYHRREYLFMGAPPNQLEVAAARVVREALVARMTFEERYNFIYFYEIQPKVQALPLPIRLKEFIQFSK